MAVKNSLTKSKKDVSIVYDSNGTKVKLSPSIIKNYLVNGQNENVSDQEIVMFLNLCRAQKLNPYLREAYLIKYGSAPATIVTGKEVFTKRAMRNKSFEGYEAGVITMHEDGQLENRVGSFVPPSEKLVGGWAKVYVNGYSVPIEAAVAVEEYIGTKNNGEVNSQWSKRPATMIRKVALTQALREAFPEDLQGMYSQEEIDIGDVDLPESPVEICDDTPQEIQPEIGFREESEPQEYDPFD